MVVIAGTLLAKERNLNYNPFDQPHTHTDVSVSDGSVDVSVASASGTPTVKMIGAPVGYTAWK